MLRITGGKVYDPANGVDGVVKDICIADGRIVADASRAAAPSTRRGMVVFPGGVDVHTHVAGAALNFARGHDRRRTIARHARSSTRRSAAPASAGITPTTFATGYLYAGMGYTTVNEAAVPILSARHTHEELRDTPIVDKSCLVLMANNEIVLDLLEAGEPERAQHVVAWLIWAAKAYGVKAVNPGGVAAWKWGKNAKRALRAGRRLPARSRRRRSSPAWPASSTSWACRIRSTFTATTSACRATSTTTIETMKVLEGQRAHLAHLQFHAYGGDDWGTMRSECRARSPSTSTPTRTSRPTPAPSCSATP